ncbi:MAG: transposase [Acidobacteriota bacterium]
MLTDAQWPVIEPLLLEFKRGRDNRGRPWASNRNCLGDILWVRWTAEAWWLLPDKYPSPASCRRRLKRLGRAKCLARRLADITEGLGGEGLPRWW